MGLHWRLALSSFSLLWCRASCLLQGDTNLLDSGDSWMGDVRGRSAVRNSSLSLAGAAWKGSAHSEWWGQLPAGSGDLGLRSACCLAGCCCPEALPSQAPHPFFTAGRRASLGSCCCSPSSLSSLGTSVSCSSYQDLARHIVDISMTDVRN